LISSTQVYWSYSVPGKNNIYSANSDGTNITLIISSPDFLGNLIYWNIGGFFWVYNTPGGYCINETDFDRLPFTNHLLACFTYEILPLRFPDFPIIAGPSMAFDQANDILYVRTQRWIYEISLDTGTFREIGTTPLYVDYTSNPTLTLDPVRNILYYNIYSNQDSTTAGIYRLDLDTGTPSMVLAGQVDGLAVNPITGDIFYSSSTLGNIYQCASTGTSCQEIITPTTDPGFSPSTLFLDPVGQKLYWIDVIPEIDNNIIVSANLDGSAVTIVVQGEKTIVQGIQGFAVSGTGR